MRLVLLPGMDGTGELFAPLLGALPPDRASVVAYPRDVVLSYDELVAFVVQRLPVEEPFVLVAESFSGPIAVRVAAQHPAGLRGVVLCANFVVGPLPFSRALVHAVRPFKIGASSLQASVLTWRLLGSAGSPLRGPLMEAVASVEPEVMAARVEVEDVDAPHLVLQVAPERCAAILSRFVASVESGCG